MALLAGGLGMVSGAEPASAGNSGGVVVLHLVAGAPSTTLTVDERKVGVLKSLSGIRFQLPPGSAGRLRAGRGPGAGAGTWPVFYANVPSEAGKTKYLQLALTTATSSGITQMYAGNAGYLTWPTTTTAVTKGEFRAITAAEALKLMAPIKVQDVGLISARK